jgi:hypothetical protein
MTNFWRRTHFILTQSPPRPERYSDGQRIDPAIGKPTEVDESEQILQLPGMRRLA